MSGRRVSYNTSESGGEQNSTGTMVSDAAAAPWATGGPCAGQVSEPWVQRSHPSVVPMDPETNVTPGVGSTSAMHVYNPHIQSIWGSLGASSPQLPLPTGRSAAFGSLVVQGLRLSPHSNLHQRGLRQESAPGLPHFNSTLQETASEWPLGQGDPLA